MDERRINENFSLILREPKCGAQGQPRKFEVCGYGQNSEIGAFTITGSIELLSMHKLQYNPLSRVDQKEMRRLKLAKFSLVKVYKDKLLEELLDD